MFISRTSKIILAAIVILVVLQIVVSSKLGSIGKSVAEMNAYHLALSEKNLTLEQKIASASALSAIQKEAVLLGFKKTGNAVFLDDSVYVVQR